MSTYVCCICGGTFEFVPDAEEEAQAEWERDYPDLDVSEQAICCDDCYKIHAQPSREFMAGR